MKFLLFFSLLFSISMFAQNSYRDTLILINGRSFPCTVTGISNEKIDILYLDNKAETVILPSIKRLTIEEYGTIYILDEGFSKNRRQVEEFIAKRYGKIKDEEIARKEQEKMASLSQNVEMEMKGCSEKHECLNQNREKKNKWSFGVLYVPYYSGKIYSYQQISSNPLQYEMYGYANNETNMEAQLSFALTDEVSLTLNTGYTSTYLETRSESHTRGNDYTYAYNSGSIEKNDLTLLNINVGMKFYLKDIVVQKVSVYGLLGLGKQFAFAEEKNENLFPDPQYPQQFSQNNNDEFQEDLNSPFQFNIGFGAEYFFNESLSLTSNIRFIYSRITAKYDSRIISQTQSNTNTIDYEKSDFITRIGLGINFYF